MTHLDQKQRQDIGLVGRGDMGIGALQKLLTKATKGFTQSDLEGFIKSEARRGALPKSKQDYYDEFDPKTYYHGTKENIKKFDPQINPNIGAFSNEGKESSRGATYFTSNSDLANTILPYPNFKPNYPEGSQIYPVKIKTKDVFDFENPDHVIRLEDRILGVFSEDSAEFEMIGDVKVGNWQQLEEPNIQDALKKLGFSGYRTNEAGTIGLFNSDKGDVRSLYAKFDPKQAKSGEIMASIVPYASVGTIGALAGLDEGT